jgi:hypothetical protein
MDHLLMQRHDRQESLRGPELGGTGCQGQAVLILGHWFFHRHLDSRGVCTWWILSEVKFGIVQSI